LGKSGHEDTTAAGEQKSIRQHAGGFERTKAARARSLFC
jgi:hypothetical protein